MLNLILVSFAAIIMLMAAPFVLAFVFSCTAVAFVVIMVFLVAAAMKTVVRWLWAWLHSYGIDSDGSVFIPQPPPMVAPTPPSDTAVLALSRAREAVTRAATNQTKATVSYDSDTSSATTAQGSPTSLAGTTTAATAASRIGQTSLSAAVASPSPSAGDATTTGRKVASADIPHLAHDYPPIRTRRRRNWAATSGLPDPAGSQPGRFRDDYDEMYARGEEIAATRERLLAQSEASGIPPPFGLQLPLMRRTTRPTAMGVSGTCSASGGSALAARSTSAERSCHQVVNSPTPPGVISSSAVEQLSGSITTSPLAPFSIEGRNIISGVREDHRAFGLPKSDGFLRDFGDIGGYSIFPLTEADADQSLLISDNLNLYPESHIPPSQAVTLFETDGSGQNPWDRLYQSGFGVEYRQMTHRRLEEEAQGRRARETHEALRSVELEADRQRSHAASSRSSQASNHDSTCSLEDAKNYYLSSRRSSNISARTCMASQLSPRATGREKADKALPEADGQSYSQPLQLDS